MQKFTKALISAIKAFHGEKVSVLSLFKVIKMSKLFNRAFVLQEQFVEKKRFDFEASKVSSLNRESKAFE